MNNHLRISFERLYGGMTTDYFAFFCPKCNQELTGVVIEEEFALYKGKARCDKCDQTYEFKLAKWHGKAL